MDWSRIETIWQWIQSQFVDYNGVISVEVYDELHLYDRAIGHKRHPRQKTNFSRVT